MGETEANHACGGEPVIIARGTGGSLHSHQLILPRDLLGSSHQSPQHVLIMASSGDEAYVLLDPRTRVPAQFPFSLAGCSSDGSRGWNGCRALPLFTAGVLQGWGEGGFY